MCLVFILLLLTPFAAGATEDEPRNFIKGSFAEIVTAKVGKPFIVSLWSVDCPPCIRELKLWSELRTDHPEMALVLISTDGVDARTDVNTLLQKTLFSKTSSTRRNKPESWVFADEFEARLRFEIDPKWYGELPHTIFFSRDHSRQNVSGLLKREQIELWLQQQAQ